MSDQTIPKIEDEIRELLDGEVKETALGFVTYLKDHNMTPQQWFCPTIWRVPYRENYLCGIFMNQTGKFRIYFFKGDYSGVFEERFIKAVHDNVKPCIDCGGECPKGMLATVFGKEFENTCFQFPVQFENPDSDMVDHIKELIEYWKDAVTRSDSWHVR